MTFREDLLGKRFESEDGKLTFEIHRSDRDNKDEYPLVVDIWNPARERLDSERYVARWEPASNPESKSAHERLDRLFVELTAAGWGDMYFLMFARPTDDRSRYHGYDWITLAEDTPLTDMVVFPEYGGSPFMDDWDWQDGWWYPYSNYRLAPPGDASR